MISISQRFDDAVIFLPQLLAASNTMEAAIKVLDPVKGANGNVGKGTIVLGTVHGDIHEIGKNVIGAMLRGAGYQIIDLGNFCHGNATRSTRRTENHSRPERFTEMHRELLVLGSPQLSL
jgi:cobalamin-dependent methionine synthase I